MHALSCVVEAGKAVSMSPSIGPIGPIERDILTALLLCAWVPDFKIYRLITFRSSCAGECKQDSKGSNALMWQHPSRIPIRSQTVAYVEAI